ncbi:MAG: hypothetical protein JXA03_10760 [Bacteroidales bacterium]|nr:hypothetical protein [Bacteroidales bacterium]
MNTKTNPALLAFMILVTGLLFSGCKKDDDDDDNPAPSNAYRIIEEIFYEDGQEDTRDVIEYADNKIKRVTNYDYSAKAWSFASKDELSYPDASTVEIITYDYDDDNWIEDDKEVIKFANNLWSESTSYNFDGAAWNPTSKSSYEYSGTKLMKMTDYDYLGGIEIAVMKMEYGWGGEILLYATTFSFDGTAWQEITKDTITYEEGVIAKIETFSFGSNAFVTRHEFAYESGKLKSISIYNVDFLEIWHLAFVFSYLYDEAGNLIEQTQVIDYMGISKTYETVYSYEKGSGNFRQLWGAGNGWYSWYPIPTKNPGDKQAQIHRYLNEITN